jgi:hypothetical protein
VSIGYYVIVIKKRHEWLWESWRERKIRYMEGEEESEEKEKE